MVIMQIEDVLIREIRNLLKKNNIRIINERAEAIQGLLEQNFGKLFIILFKNSNLFVKLFNFFNQKFLKYNISFERLEPINNEIWRERICLNRKNKIIDDILLVVEDVY